MACKVLRCSLGNGVFAYWLDICLSYHPAVSTDRRPFTFSAFLTMSNVTVKLKTNHARKLAADAKKRQKGTEELLGVILEDFFRGWRSDKRWLFYQQYGK